MIKMFKLRMIKISDYPFQAIEKAPKVFEKETMAAMWKSVLTLQAAVKKRTPVGAGPAHLKDSILADVRGQKADIRGTVMTPLLHGAPVETGTKPHMPPFQPIYYWVYNKLHLPFGEAKKAARAIQWKIYHAGTSSQQLAKTGDKGFRMFEKSWEASEPKINGFFDVAADHIRAEMEGK